MANSLLIGQQLGACILLLSSVHYTGNLADQALHLQCSSCHSDFLSASQQFTNEVQCNAVRDSYSHSAATKMRNAGITQVKKTKKKGSKKLKS